MAISPQRLQKLLLCWFDQHGRKNLPWQRSKTPYRVWISEIMLQQTQVNTVIPYFERFMTRFPDLSSLATAHEDEVLHLWAGLGYYSRARNLHQAAKMIAEKYQGQFPATLVELINLPGIGRSTAGAILAIAYQKPATILDGNVKRVFTRLFGITEPINEKSIENKLWQLAEKYTPKQRIADYTQAIMDLGATCCVRSKPQCLHCPLSKHCQAFHQGMTEQLPKKKNTRTLPLREATFLILKKGESVLLHKRSPLGIWGGLWSLPEIAGKPVLETIQQFCRQHFQLSMNQYQSLHPFRHTFSHFHLDIFPVLISIRKMPAKIMGSAEQIWYDPRQPKQVGLPKPVQSILNGLINHASTMIQ